MRDTLPSTYVLENNFFFFNEKNKKQQQKNLKTDE